ncbi:COG2426 family protein [Botryobacter ruber]|uniref:COG2426 family protein n=1 Tax=Botryobacter ruber TaxID=2171629 RepID=UPI000E0BDDA4|nr:small multi-drug export protein [Botryobacter ruber]
MPLALAFAVSLLVNLFIFPILMWLIDTFSVRLWPNRLYRRAVINLSKQAKRVVGADIQKYGFGGLMVFVMIPLPGTGAYMGTIAAYVLRIERGKALLAVSLGVFISCILMAAGSYYGNMGLNFL